MSRYSSVRDFFKPRLTGSFSDSGFLDEVEVEVETGAVAGTGIYEGEGIHI